MYHIQVILRLLIKRGVTYTSKTKEGKSGVNVNKDLTPKTDLSFIQNARCKPPFTEAKTEAMSC